MSFEHGEPIGVSKQLDYKYIRQKVLQLPLDRTKAPFSQEYEAFARDTAELEEQRRQMRFKEEVMRKRTVQLAKIVTAATKSDCRQLAITFHSAMPRELRDFVYSRLNSELDGLCENGYLRSISWTHNYKAHWLKPDFVGPKFARECAENYYGHSDFLFYDGDLPALGDLFSNDFFGLGIVPADHIRSCHIDLVILKAPGCVSENTEHLLPLLDLKHVSGKVTFRINIAPLGELFRLGVLVAYLELLLPVVHQLKNNGLTVTTLVSSVKEYHKGRYPDPLSIDYVWDMASEELVDKLGRCKKIFDVASNTSDIVLESSRLQKCTFVNEEDHADMLRLLKSIPR